jgi:hypothetical protein
MPRRLSNLHDTDASCLRPSEHPYFALTQCSARNVIGHNAEYGLGCGAE